MRKFSLALFAVAALAVTLSATPNALAQGAEAPAKQVTKLGYLSCHVASGWGFIFGSSRKLQCTYTPADKAKKVEEYSGSITKFGADIGYLQSGVILWTVVTPGMKITPHPGLLSGHYGGATASATVGLGLGGNVLVGGMDGSISLQPLSIEGTTGLNVAAGVAMMNLKFEHVVASSN
ncbi:MAG TPA: DUF992 domain-containing protein [Candidatus Binataceae bacterium]|nr:DUF992 domain-containing protein [Candidatus Binataceae bacterium]